MRSQFPIGGNILKHSYVWVQQDGAHERREARTIRCDSGADGIVRMKEGQPG